MGSGRKKIRIFASYLLCRAGRSENRKMTEVSDVCLDEVDRRWELDGNGRSNVAGKEPTAEMENKRTRVFGQNRFHVCERGMILVQIILSSFHVSQPSTSSVGKPYPAHHE
ncbi:hypothetical protein Adt_48492 [Abeliophyllum distichum]|uniref:Uncharacterized protein n=1 Tax=Abeliophyllum distichum TaxID=126358 RepID=A0ABD1NQV9_9LAMI